MIDTVVKGLSANNGCGFIAVFLVFPGFLLNKLHQLFSDSSYVGIYMGGLSGLRTLILLTASA